MKKILTFILPLLLIVFVAAVGFADVSALTLREGAEAARCDGCPANFIVGIIAVIMLIIGGIKYVVSGGDSKKVTDAKNTVLYAIIGLVIAFLAFAIVNFVISALPNAETAMLLQSANG